MSKTLVVSDNEMLNLLYVVNLEVYLGTAVTLAMNLEEAKSHLLSSTKFNLIITMNMISDEDCASVVAEVLEKAKLNVPQIVIGKPQKDLANAVVVQSSYHLQNLLRTCSKLLGVTAQSMASMEVPDYFPIAIKYLTKVHEAPCQLYLLVKKTGEPDSFTILAKRLAPVSEIISKFIDDGIETIYVLKNDRLSIVNCVTSALTTFIQNSMLLDTKGKTSALKEGFEFIASDYCQTPEVAQEVMALANTCTNVIEEVTKESPSLKSLLQILTSNKAGYVYVHTMLAAFVAAHIVKKVPWGGESQIEKINFVLFFHDIALTHIYLKYPKLKDEEEILFSEEVEDADKEVVLNHARMSAEIVLGYKKSPLGADLLIKQHHGMTNGVGFAIDYKDDISPLSKVVIIAEAFVSEYLKAKEIYGDSGIDAKLIIPTLNEKFRKSSYRKIVETLDSLKL
jgi:hypothetical protein